MSFLSIIAGLASCAVTGVADALAAVFNARLRSPSEDRDPSGYRRLSPLSKERNRTL